MQLAHSQQNYFEDATTLCEKSRSTLIADNEITQLLFSGVTD